MTFWGLKEQRVRQDRMNHGCCPVHNIPFTQVGVAYEDGMPVGDVVECPRKDCGFKIEVRPGTKLWVALHG